MTGTDLAQQLVNKKSLQKFLKRKDVQEALQDEDFEKVYFLANGCDFIFTGQLHWLFEEAGINPWHYLNTYLPSRYFDTELVLKSIKIPGKFQTIGEMCFAHAETLEEIELDEGVEYIAAGAFHSCSTLKKVTLPSSIKPLTNYLFKSCIQLKEIKYCGDISTAKANIFSRSDVLAESGVTKIICNNGEIGAADGHIIK